MMFWRERERDTRDQNGYAPLCGQVRVLVVGDSGKKHANFSNYCNFLGFGSWYFHPQLGSNIQLIVSYWRNWLSFWNSTENDWILKLLHLNLVAGVGKTSLVNLILKGSAISRPSQTIGCTVGVKVWLQFLFVFNFFPLWVYKESLFAFGILSWCC